MLWPKIPCGGKNYLARSQSITEESQHQTANRNPEAGTMEKFSRLAHSLSCSVMQSMPTCLGMVLYTVD